MDVTREAYGHMSNTQLHFLAWLEKKSKHTCYAQSYQSCPFVLLQRKKQQASTFALKIYLIGLPSKNELLYCHPEFCCYAKPKLIFQLITVMQSVSFPSCAKLMRVRTRRDEKVTSIV